MRLYILILTLLVSFGVSAQVTYIHCGSLLTMESNSVQKEKTIIVEGQRISSIVNGFKAVSYTHLTLPTKA